MGNLDDSRRAVPPEPTTLNKLTSGGQNHDRLAGVDEVIDEANMSAPGPTPAVAIPDITVPQKMMSAMSGSLFTSLLGETNFEAHRFHRCRTHALTWARPYSHTS